VAEPILTPGDVEAAAVAYLKASIVDVPGLTVSTRRPFGTDWQAAAPPILRVQLVSGAAPRDVVLDEAVLSVEGWHATTPLAFGLVARAVGLLNAWSGVWAGVLVYGCEAFRPRHLADPLTSHPRYLATATVTARLNGA